MQGETRFSGALPSGKFQVLAGDGKRGFSGDGGPAVRAEINFGLTRRYCRREGTAAVYFADSATAGSREVLPDGHYRDGRRRGDRIAGQRSPLPSRDFGQQFSLFGLAIGPNGELYIGTSGVYRPWPRPHPSLGRRQVGQPEGLAERLGRVYSNPAIQSDFTPVARLAFDGKGDLLVAGGGGFGIYEMTTTGKFRFVEPFRGDGYWGSLAEASNGSVVLSYRDGIFRFLPSGTIKPLQLSATTAASPLNAALGKRSIFIGGDGVAAGRNGVIYVDTNVGNTFARVSAYS